MRNMLLDELNGGGDPVIIKARRSRRAANMLEQTYRRCQDLVAENQRECEALYQQQYQAGFRAGFQHLYQQWLIQLDEWAGLQKELAQARRVQLAEDLTALFTQPSIVEFIVKQLTQTTGIDVPSVVVLPAGITPPDSLLHIHCISGGDDNFAVQQGERVVRFPQDSLCRQWLTDIDTQEGIRELQRHIDTLPSALLYASASMAGSQDLEVQTYLKNTLNPLVTQSLGLSYAFNDFMQAMICGNEDDAPEPFF